MRLKSLYFSRIFVALLIVCFLIPDLEAQSPYELNGLKEGLITGSSIGLFTFSRIKYKKLEPLSIEHINRLKREDVLAIDRGATDNNSALARTLSDYMLYSSPALPLSMLAGEQSREDFGKGSLFILETLLVNFAVMDLTKVLGKRTRPFVYNDAFTLDQKLTRNARNSFFSGHTSTVASMYFLTAKMYSDYYPDSKWKPAVWSVAVLVPAATGFMRVKGGKHYFTDVLTGFVVGAAIGILVPEIHKIGT